MIKSDGVFEDFFGAEGIDVRFFNWLYFYTSQVRGDDFMQKFAAATNKYWFIVDELESRRISAGQILSLWGKSMVLSRDVVWLENDKRFFEWFVCKLRFGLEGLFRAAPLKIGYKDLCVSMADLMSSIEDPIPLKDWQRRWVEVKEFKSIVSWVEGGEEKIKIEFVSRAFKNKGLRFPEPDIQRFEDFLFWVDRSNLSRLELDYISARAKRSWQQQNYRGDGSKRRQVNMMLDVDVVRKLEILSNEHGLSKAKIVQVLLEEECSRRLYISKRRADMAKGEI